MTLFWIIVLALIAAPILAFLAWGILYCSWYAFLWLFWLVGTGFMAVLNFLIPTKKEDYDAF
jgi:hypothetical protein